jgi:hypothetical protein
MNKRVDPSNTRIEQSVSVVEEPSNIILTQFTPTPMPYPYDVEMTVQEISTEFRLPVRPSNYKTVMLLDHPCSITIETSGGTATTRTAVLVLPKVSGVRITPEKTTRIKVAHFFHIPGEAPSEPLYFDGSWMLDGEYTLDGFTGDIV